MIPAEAVEAAAKAIHRYDVREGLASTYAPNEHHRAEARAALEAAAPYMQLCRNALMDIIADAYGDQNQGHLSLKAADAILAAGGQDD